MSLEIIINVLSYLDAQISAASDHDLKDENLTNLENRLHNLSLNAAALEQEKRDIKWKASFVNTFSMLRVPKLLVFRLIFYQPRSVILT